MILNDKSRTNCVQVEFTLTFYQKLKSKLTQNKGAMKQKTSFFGVRQLAQMGRASLNRTASATSTLDHLFYTTPITVSGMLSMASALTKNQFPRVDFPIHLTRLNVQRVV